MDFEQIILMIGEQKAKTEEYGKQLEKLFVKVEDIKSSVDTNVAQMESTEKSIVEMKTLIQNVDKKIENGLRAEVGNISQKVEGLYVCVESLKECKDGVHCGEEKEDGAIGFFKEGWIQVRKRLSFIFVFIAVLCNIVVAVGLSAYIIMCVLFQHKFPDIILKLLG